MNEERVTTRTTLLEHIERDWLAINALLDSIRPEQWVDVRNGDGWAIKDHVAHLSAWEGVVIALLQGNLPYVALGVSEAVYRDADYDRINNVVFERHRADKVESVRQR
ncbi:MAG: ClbS/DfsB family four-helix bundle protein, partial [Chloroflexota bacterium]